MGWLQSPAFFTDFGAVQGWTSPSYYRLITDIDFNGTSDYVGFGTDHVTLAWGGTQFGPQSSIGPGFIEVPDKFDQIHDFGTVQGYSSLLARGATVVGGARTTNDLDATVWAQGSAGFYYYSPNSEQTHSDAAGKSYYVADYIGPKFIAEFGAQQGWTSAHHIEVVHAIADDTTNSILGFGDNGLVVAQDAFGAIGPTSYAVNTAVGNAAGWVESRDIRTFQDHFNNRIDLDRNGATDFVGMGPNGLVYSYGEADDEGKYFISDPIVADIRAGGGADLGVQQGWTDQTSVRYIADINDDSYVDIIAFGYDGVYVSLGQDSTSDPFGTLYKATNNFGSLQGWSVDDHLRIIGDVNGDDVIDIVGFGYDRTFYAPGKKDASGVVTFDDADILNPDNQINDFGAAQGWSNSGNLRELGDVNGDGNADIIASGYYGTTVYYFDT